MKRKLNRIIILFATINCLICCSSYKKELLKGSFSNSKAINNIILDFVNTYKTPSYYLKKRDGKPFNVFWINKKESDNNLSVFTVFPEIDGFISIGIKDSIDKIPNSSFPNNFKVKEGKLFIWRDSLSPLKKDILLALDNFGVLDSVDVKIHLGLIPSNVEDNRIINFDDKLKGINYFICKNSILKYKKIITNKAYGHYKQPKLNCDNTR